MTLAPPPARVSAVARPIPRDAPVTSATLFTNVPSNTSAPPPIPSARPHRDHAVLSPKPEGVGERQADRSLAGAVRDVIEVALRVRRIEIDRRRDSPVSNRQDPHHRGQRP